MNRSQANGGSMSGFLQEGRPPLVLASSSAARARLLKAAGLEFSVRPADLDEATMREAISGESGLGPADIAEVLARAKAEAISEGAGGAFVIGADQVLEFDGEILGKPETMEQARLRLLDLAGKTHRLHTAVALSKDGESIFAHGEVAALTMRAVSPAFIGRYLAAAGPDVLNSVGAYQIESLGIELFAKIDGDFFSILGLPLLPLLDALRRQGAIES
jgi:septum formation protein